MTQAVWTPETVGTNCETPVRVTRSLLGYGVLAGPFYVVISLIQALTRAGFELSQHPWSVLANGEGGWIQTTNLILTGLMVIAAAVGMRRLLNGGKGGTWAPALIGVFGLGMVAGGIFKADPVAGFPAGTTAPTEMSVSGMLHFLCGGVGFLCFIAACFVIARRFDRAWATYSRITGVVFLLAFGGLAAGPGFGIIAFTIGVLASFAWLAATSVRLYRHADR
jgi:hypothetical membrane protein